MKKKITKEVQAQIEAKKKLPAELKENRNKLLIENLWFAIFITLYFIFLNMGFFNIVKNIFVEDTKVFSGIALAIAIIFFERAFKKDNGKMAVHGIEILVLAIITLFIPYLYYLNQEYTRVTMVCLIVGYNIYYIAKATVISARTKSKYLSSLSDVKNIIKKEKRAVVEVSEEELEKIEEPKIKETKIKETKVEEIPKPKRTRKTVEKEKTEVAEVKPKSAARKKTNTQKTKQTTSTKTKQEKTSDKPVKRATKKTEKSIEEKPKTTTRKRTTKKKEEEK